LNTKDALRQQKTPFFGVFLGKHFFQFATGNQGLHIGSAAH
jgi:hypothetical protein